MGKLYKLTSSLALALLAGCAGVVANPPIAPGQSVQLQAGEGIAALLMDTQDPLTQVRLASTDDKNPVFDLPSMPAGKTLAMFAAPAGVYCLKQFDFGRYRFFTKALEVGCFQVTAGHISYSGDLQPTANPNPVKGHDDVFVYQAYEPQVFLALLKQQYPQVAAAYPTAGPSPASEGDAQNDSSREMATWVVASADRHSEDVYFRNNTNWTLVLGGFDVTVCTNLKQACGEQGKPVAVQPNTTIKYTTLEQADLRQAYEASYRYRYIKVPMGTKL